MQHTRLQVAFVVSIPSVSWQQEARKVNKRVELADIEKRRKSERTARPGLLLERLLQRLHESSHGLSIVGGESGECFLVRRFLAVVALGEQVRDLSVGQGSTL